MTCNFRNRLVHGAYQGLGTLRRLENSATFAFWSLSDMSWWLVQIAYCCNDDEHANQEEYMKSRSPIEAEVMGLHDRNPIVGRKLGV